MLDKRPVMRDCASMNAKRLDRLVSLAKALKPSHQTGRAFHVSYILDGPKILSVGINSYFDSHPNSILPDYHKSDFVDGLYLARLHSEVAAAKKLRFKCSGLVLVNVRIDNNNSQAYSAPCVNCWEHIVKRCGFKKVYFTNGSSFTLQPVK
jgi:deoxycytidylate deaminase